MKKNRMRICGKNTNTLPTPAKMPSLSKLRKRPSGNDCVLSVPSSPMPNSMPFMNGSAQENTAWKIKNINIASSAKPKIGCSTTPSMASSRASVVRGITTQAANMSRTAWCKSPATGSGSWRVSGLSSVFSSAFTPSRRVAIVSTTSMPSVALSAATSMVMPRRFAASIMFSAKIIGLPKRIASSTKRKCRRKLVASATQTIRSGAGSSASSPRQTARVIASSGLVALRL